MQIMTVPVLRGIPLAAAVGLLAVLPSACSKGTAATPQAPTTVAVVDVVKQDVPLRTEWVATLDGYVNARIQPQVTGYLIKQSYVEGSFVKKGDVLRSEEHTSELQSRLHLVCRLLLEKKKMSDLNALALINQLYAQYVLDSISTGAVIALAMECYEPVIITKEMTSRLDRTWSTTHSSA